MISSTNLKNWALGKAFQDGPWQGFNSPQFKELMRKGESDEKECECILASLVL